MHVVVSTLFVKLERAVRNYSYLRLERDSREVGMSTCEDYSSTSGQLASCRTMFCGLSEMKLLGYS
jgi:hypothetical protein